MKINRVTEREIARVVFPSIIAISISLSPITGVALAQSEPDDANVKRTLDTVTVTARKREESLQDAPLAVSAVSQDQLDRAGVVDSTRLSDIAPNVNIASDSNRDSLFITIRGVSGTDTRNTADPTTAFHIDGVSIPRLSGANAYFFDLERVEILRGPQGTLYGKNATSGVVNVVSKKPDHDYSGSAEVTVGNFNLVRTRGHLNLPIIEDKLAIRAAFSSEDRDGYRDNGPLLQDGDDADDTAARLHVLFEPTDRLDILLTGEIFRKRGVGRVQGFIDFPGNPNPQYGLSDPQEFPLDAQSFRTQDDTAFRWELKYDLDFAEFVYLGGWREHDRELFQDLDGTDLVDSTVGEVFDSTAVSHEVRLTSTTDDRLSWILGAMVFEEDIDSVFNIQIPTTTALSGVPTVPFDRLDFDFDVPNQTNEGLGIFANLGFALTDALNVTGGIRYSEDEKKRPEGNQVIRRINSVGPPPLSILPQAQEADFDKVTWKLGLDWKATDQVLAYASVGTGYKAGGFNRGEFVGIFGPENITAYEVGSKVTTRDNRLRFNTAAFLYEYEDLQQAQVTPQPDGTIVNETVNAAEATIWGLEGELEAVPYDGGLVSIVAGYLNTEFDDFQNIENPITGVVEDLSGNDLVFAPEVTVTLLYQPYTFRIPEFGTLTPTIQVHYEAESALNIQNDAFATRDSFTRTNLSLRYEDAAGRYSAEAFVHNLEDEDILSAVQAGTAVIGPPSFGGGPSQKGVFDAPRTYGFRIGARF